MVKLLQETLTQVRYLNRNFTDGKICFFQEPGHPLCRLLRPRFTLVGSVPENTRQGLLNELDLTVVFQGLKDNMDGPPFRTGDNPIAYFISMVN